MHPNPTYRTTPEQLALECALQRGFGMLTVQTAQGLAAAHIPFALHDGGDDGDKVLELHLMRANPLAKAAPRPPYWLYRWGMLMSALIGMVWQIRCPPGFMGLCIFMALCAPYQRIAWNLF